MEKALDDDHCQTYGEYKKWLQEKSTQNEEKKEATLQNETQQTMSERNEELKNNLEKQQQQDEHNKQLEEAEWTYGDYKKWLNNGSKNDQATTTQVFKPIQQSQQEMVEICFEKDDQLLVDIDNYFNNETDNTDDQETRSETYQQESSLDDQEKSQNDMQSLKCQTQMSNLTRNKHTSSEESLEYFDAMEEIPVEDLIQDLNLDKHNEERIDKFSHVLLEKENAQKLAELKKCEEQLQKDSLYLEYMARKIKDTIDFMKESAVFLQILDEKIPGGVADIFGKKLHSIQETENEMINQLKNAKDQHEKNIKQVLKWYNDLDGKFDAKRIQNFRNQINQCMGETQKSLNEFIHETLKDIHTLGPEVDVDSLRNQLTNLIDGRNEAGEINLPDDSDQEADYHNQGIVLLDDSVIKETNDDVTYQILLAEHDLDGEMPLHIVDDLYDMDTNVKNPHYIMGGGSDTESDDTSDTSINDDKPKTKKKVDRRKKVKYIWEEDSPTATVYQTNVKHKQFDEETALSFVNDCNDFTPKNGKILKPNNGDCVAYENVEHEDIIQLAKMDAYKWRFKGIKHVQRSIQKRIKVYSFHSECQTPQVYHKNFSKYAMYDQNTKKAVMVYEGNPEYGIIDHRIVMNAPEEEWPDQSNIKFPAICDLLGPQEHIDRYKETFKDQLTEIPETVAAARKTATELADSQTLETATGTVEMEDSDSEFGAITEDEELEMKPSERKKPFYRKATPGMINVDEGHIKICASQIDNLREQADRENRWEDASVTQISNPKGGEVYFRDISKLNCNAENKEKADGVRWCRSYRQFTRKNKIFLARGEYSGVKVNTDTMDEEQAPDPRFVKYMYILPCHDKMIIHYKGDHNIVQHRPHGNSKSKTAMFFPASGEVKEKILSFPRDMSHKRVHEELTSTTEPGILASIVNPRDLRMVQNARLKAERERKTSLDIMYAAQVVSDVVGNGDNFVRGMNFFQENARYVVMAHPDVVNEYKTIMKLRTAEDPPQVYHIDTSYNAGGRGENNLLLTQISMPHPAIVRTKGIEGERETGANFLLTAMIHQRRDNNTMTHFIQDANATFGLQNHPSIVVSDREFEVLDYWRGAKKALCWNHIKNNVSFNANHKFGHRSNEDKRNIQADVHRLLSSRTTDSYEERLRACFDGSDTNAHPVWRDRNFQDYFRRAQVLIIY